MKTTGVLKGQLAALEKKIAETKKAIEILGNIESPDIRFVADIPTSWPEQCAVTASDSDPYHACSAVYKLFFQQNKEKKDYKHFGRKIHLFVRTQNEKMLVSLSYRDANKLIQNYCKKNGLPNPEWEISRNNNIGTYYRTANGSKMPNVHFAS